MEVERVDNISYAGFMQEFYRPEIPVVYKNTSKVWKAKHFFTPDWFPTLHGEQTTGVKGKTFTMQGEGRCKNGIHPAGKLACGVKDSLHPQR